MQLVRQRHNTDGHCALSKTVANLDAEGAFASKKLNMADVRLFSGDEPFLIEWLEARMTNSSA